MHSAAQRRYLHDFWLRAHTLLSVGDKLDALGVNIADSVGDSFMH